MSVTIRLRRIGRKRQPYYRVVVADSRNASSGAYLESLGHYTSTSKPAELRLDLARLDDWIARGATMSETVKSLVSKARKGGDASVAYLPTAAEPSAPAAAAAPPAAVPAPAAAAPEAEAAAPEPEVAAPEPEVAAPEPEAAAPEPEVAAPEPEAAAPEAEAAAPEAEAAAPEAEAAGPAEAEPRAAE